MLLGIEANIPDGLYDQFNATGTSHVIVISGSNVALISGVIVAVAARLLGKRRALWPALAAIAAYALLVGGEASVLRASVMGGLFVTATALQRRSTALVSLAAACMAMTLANPLVLWDVGLHLSSMATAGLVLLAPALSGGLRRLLGLSLGWLRVAGEDVLAITLAASVTTLPLSLYYFDRFSLSSPPGKPDDCSCPTADPVWRQHGVAGGAGRLRSCWRARCCGCPGWGWRGPLPSCAGRRGCPLRP